MKQTAVNYLENQIKKSKYYYYLMKDLHFRSTIVQDNIFEQAKKIEKKQQIKEGKCECTVLQVIPKKKVYIK